jgi:hypothetical protein
MMQHKILKHLVALFFVLALLTVFATQWETAKDTQHLIMDRPIPRPGEMERTPEKLKQESPKTKDVKQEPSPEK